MQCIHTKLCGCRLQKSHSSAADMFFELGSRVAVRAGLAMRGPCTCVRACATTQRCCRSASATVTWALSAGSTSATSCPPLPSGSKHLCVFGSANSLGFFAIFSVFLLSLCLSVCLYLSVCLFLLPFTPPSLIYLYKREQIKKKTKKTASVCTQRRALLLYLFMSTYNTCIISCSSVDGLFHCFYASFTTPAFPFV